MARRGSIAVLAIVLGWGCASNKRSEELLRLDTAIEIQGNVTFSDQELLGRVEEEITVPADRAPTKAEVDDAAYAIEELYREQGFAFARVDYEYLDDPDLTVHARLSVQEGNRVLLDEVRLEGNSHFSSEELLAFLSTAHGGMFSDARYYVQRDLSTFVDDVAAFYYRSGFQESRVSPPEVTFDDARTRARAVVRIAEGPRFVLEEIRFAGDLSFSRSEHLALVRQFLGTPYTPRLGALVRAKILDAYSRRGHPDCSATISDSRDEQTGAVALTLNITPGPEVTVSSIVIEGNEHTRAGLIRSRVSVEVGRPYNADEVRASLRRLYRSGLFEEITIELEDTDAEQRALDITVHEAPSLEFHVEPGWGSYEGPRFVAGVTERNLYGTGLQLGFEGNVSLKDQGAQLRLTEPWLFDSDTSATWNVYGRRRQEPSFRNKELGTGISVTHVWTDVLSSTAAYDFRLNRLEDADVTDPDVQELLDNVDVSSVTLSVTRDTTNDIFGPTHGNRSRFSVEWASSAIGSEVDFVAATASHTRYHSLTSSTVLAMTGRTSVIVPVASTEDLPLQLRLFNGGENSVRSFKEDELGPKDTKGDLGPGGAATNDPIGGQAASVFSVELRQGLVGNLAGAVFFDAGNVELDYQDYFDFAGFRYAVGGGLRYWLPVGPLRLDVGVNPDPKDGEDDYVIHFSIGMAF